MHTTPSLPVRPLGDSGVRATIIGLGCNNFGRRLDLAGTRRVIDAALHDGVTFFDTADIYGPSGASEELMGEALRGRRDEVVLATKFGKDMHDGDERARGSRAYLRDKLHDSLRRLQVDHVDYLWMHEPDVRTPIAETLGALQELIDAGMVGAIGCSNFDAGQLREADAAARRDGLTPFTAVQNHYSLLHRAAAERDELPTCRDLGIGYVPFFPLASGLLTGKYRSGEPAPTGTRLTEPGRGPVATDAQFALLGALAGFAQARGVGMVEVAIGYLLAQSPVVTVIAGATSAAQVASNAAAADWEPTESDLTALSEILADHPE